LSVAARLIDELREIARVAAKNAYSPYSHFTVGAAVRHPGGVQAGCNVENGSFGLTQCAERNALSAAIASGARKGSFDALLVYRPGERALPPCGACRQVMLELLAPGALVVACCDGEHLYQWRVGELLPDAFDMKEHGLD
jgi:cytidine deaminase